jgi:histidyl-tRNA synthetase
MKFTIPPGVFDITPNNTQETWKSSYLWSHVEQIIRETARSYGFMEIRTPLFERTELFQRSVGEGSDIVSKEMYTFDDKGGRSLSLKPEGTAPVIRAFIENSLYASAQVQKLFYISPMFRYERAQAGRYRQHHQFGTEVIGHASAEQDAELIDLLYTVYRRLGLKDLTLSINSIGNEATRFAFKKALKEYLAPHVDLLSPDSQVRLESNPLRILDSKDPRDQEIVAGAPSILDFLDEESRQHFDDLQHHLTSLNIPFKINHKLVRGLDYYNKAVFEIVAGELGAQNSIGGGGRYDGLIHTMGGPDLPAVGFGTGIERIIQTMINQNVPLPSIEHPVLFIAALGEDAKDVSFKLLHQLRQKNIPAQMDFSNRKLGKILQYADQIQATYTTVIGEHEIAAQEVELKEMKTGNKIKMKLADLPQALKWEIQSPSTIKLMEELSTPFESPGESQLIFNKLKTSLGETQRMVEHFHHNLEQLKKAEE